MAEQTKLISYKSLTRMARSFGSAGQADRRVLPGETRWKPTVMYAERVEGTDEVNFTTLIVKDKEFDQAYQARDWMAERMAEIFKEVGV